MDAQFTMEVQPVRKTASPPNAAPTLYRKSLGTRVLLALKRDWQLYVFMLLPVVYLLIFKYYPMTGLQLAFRKYRARDGLYGSEWIWFDNFIKFFESYQFSRTLKNTIILSAYTLICNTIIPIAFALTLNCVEKPKFKKITQTIVTLPHFISVVVLIGIVMQVLNSRTGIYGILYESLTGQYPEDIFGQLGSFRHVYVWSGVWQSFGWNAIIYIATLSGVDAGLHEAAQLDGASRFKRVLHVDLPHIMPTAITLTIMNIGKLMSLGYEKALLLQNSLNLEHSELISTYVYRVGLSGEVRSDFSFATAIDFFNAVVNLILIVVANKASKKVSDTSLW